MWRTIAIGLIGASLSEPHSYVLTWTFVIRDIYIQHVSVIAWVFDFRKFITITDVSLQAMYIASICSQYGLYHERYTKYLIPWGVE